MSLQSRSTPSVRAEVSPFSKAEAYGRGSSSDAARRSPTKIAAALMASGRVPEGEELVRFFEEVARNGWAATIEDQGLYLAIIKTAKQNHRAAFLFDAIAESIPAAAFLWSNPSAIQPVDPVRDLVSMAGWLNLDRAGADRLVKRIGLLTGMLLLHQTRRELLLRQEDSRETRARMTIRNERLQVLQEEAAVILLRIEPERLSAQSLGGVRDFAWLLAFASFSSPSARKLGEQLLAKQTPPSGGWCFARLRSAIADPGLVADHASVEVAQEIFERVTPAFDSGIFSSDHSLFTCCALLVPQHCVLVSRFAREVCEHDTGEREGLHRYALWSFIAASTRQRLTDSFGKSHSPATRWQGVALHQRQALGVLAVEELEHFTGLIPWGRLDFEESQEVIGHVENLARAVEFFRGGRSLAARIAACADRLPLELAITKRCYHLAASLHASRI